MRSNRPATDPGSDDRRATLATLAERVQRVEAGGRPDLAPAPPDAIPFPCAASGASLAMGAVHEWFPDEPPDPRWTPALILLAHIARLASERRAAPAGALIVWIGRRCWAHPRALPSPVLRRRCLYVDPPDRAAALWAADLALRSSIVAAVIADASGLDMGASRRLQLAARDGGAIGLLARPASERAIHSAAATRWRVAPSPAPMGGAHPRWTVELLRRKGLRPAEQGPRSWTVERNHAQGLVVVPADLGDRSGRQTPTLTAPARRRA